MHLVNWDTTEFELYNMFVEHYKINYICKPISPGNLTFPAQRNFVHHNYVCYRLKSRPIIVQDAGTQFALTVAVMRIYSIQIVQMKMGCSGQDGQTMTMRAT
jgi:hypothetical protein